MNFILFLLASCTSPLSHSNRSTAQNTNSGSAPSNSKANTSDHSTSNSGSTSSTSGQGGAGGNNPPSGTGSTGSGTSGSGSGSNGGSGSTPQCKLTAIPSKVILGKPVVLLLENLTKNIFLQAATIDGNPVDLSIGMVASSSVPASSRSFDATMTAADGTTTQCKADVTVLPAVQDLSCNLKASPHIDDLLNGYFELQGTVVGNVSNGVLSFGADQLSASQAPISLALSNGMFNLNMGTLASTTDVASFANDVFTINDGATSSACTTSPRFKNRATPPPPPPPMECKQWGAVPSLSVPSGFQTTLNTFYAGPDILQAYFDDGTPLTVKKFLGGSILIGTIAPTVSHTYQVIVKTSSGVSRCPGDSWSVTVIPKPDAPTCEIAATPTQVRPGEPTLIRFIPHGVFSSATVGGAPTEFEAVVQRWKSFTLYPTANTTVTGQVQGPGGTSTCLVNLTVTSQPDYCAINQNSSTVTHILTETDLIAINNKPGNYSLDADINLSTSYVPINLTNSVFLGNNHTISNLSYSSPSVHVGLFSEVTDSTVKDLTIGSVNLSSTVAAGALVGQASGVSICNVKATGGTISGGGTGSFGGLIAYLVVLNSSHVQSNHVQNCSSNVAIVASAIPSDAGGLIGVADRSAITGSSASGDISNSVQDGQLSHAGGLVGALTNSVVSNSFATGSLTDTGLLAGSSTFAGGLIGVASYSTLYDNTASGNMHLLGNYIGGFIGGALYSVANGNHATGNVEGNIGVGGFAGELVNSISLRNHSSGGVKAVLNFGGFAGLIKFASLVDECSATGDVTGFEGPGSTTAAPRFVAGGFAGAIGDGERIDYMFGDDDSTLQNFVLNSYAANHVEYDLVYPAWIGGFSGFAEKGFVANSFALGAVASTAGNNKVLGGFIPLVDETLSIANSYWNVDVSQLSVSTNGSLGLHSTQMTSSNNFVGWDFNSVWNLSGPYPRLSSP